MANPTFQATPLTTDAAAERIGPPRARLRTETMPGVHGQFAQLHGRSGRDIVVTGVFRGTPAALAADAHAALKTAVRSAQLLVGTTEGTYFGVDGHTYGHCVLLAFEPVRGVEYIASGGNLQAVTRVRAVIRDLSP